MSAHLKTILRELGLAIHVPGLMALVTLPICAAFGEWRAMPSFLATAVLALAVGQGLHRAFRGAGAMQIRQAMDVAALVWLIVPLFGALPFVLIPLTPGEATATPSLGQLGRPLNAVFEAISGFTSSGLTMTLDPAELPRSLQWWRSFMQWIGGVGVIVLMLTVLHPSGDADRLYHAEAREQAIRPDLIATVRTIWWIYALYTALAIAGLWLAGMPPWHALNYAMAGIATGGFGSSAGNAGDFGLAPRLVLIVTMVVGAISFSTHDRILTRRQPAALWHAPETRLLLAALAVGPLVLLVENRVAGGSWRWLDSAFDFVSALCTAGFQATESAAWSTSAQLLLVAAMVCGGTSGSTAGGLKLWRVALIGRGAWHRILRVARQPWRLVEHKALGDPHEARRRLEAATTLLALWLGTLAIGTSILLHVPGVAPGVAPVLLEAASALGNVGLSTGITGPELAWPGKLTLMVLMWIGRLEIVPAIVLLAALGPGSGGHR